MPRYLLNQLAIKIVFYLLYLRILFFFVIIFL
jgi:hypothetical protein